MNTPRTARGGPGLFAISDGAGFELTFMDMGATWLSCRVPLRGRMTREVLLGHRSWTDYAKQPGYLGSVVGRYANRIAHARFGLAGETYRLDINEGEHHLHGGAAGFSKQRWRCVDHNEGRVVFALDSPAGDQGYPGNLRAEVAYTVTGLRELEVGIVTSVDAACPVNLTSHAYFNLDEEHVEVSRHGLRICADYFLPVGEDLIPTGEVRPVLGSRFDFRTLRDIGAPIFEDDQLRLAKGYDHCFVLGDLAAGEPTRLAAEIHASRGDLGLSITTSYPGLQLYTGGHLDLCRDRYGRPFRSHAGLALEPQYFPDSPNRPEWPQPSSIQEPGTVREHVITYTFFDCTTDDEDGPSPRWSSSRGRLPRAN